MNSLIAWIADGNLGIVFRGGPRPIDFQNDRSYPVGTEPSSGFRTVHLYGDRTSASVSNFCEGPRPGSFRGR